MLLDELISEMSDEKDIREMVVRGAVFRNETCYPKMCYPRVAANECQEVAEYEPEQGAPNK